MKRFCKFMAGALLVLAVAAPISASVFTPGAPEKHATIVLLGLLVMFLAGSLGTYMLYSLNSVQDEEREVFTYTDE